MSCMQTDLKVNSEEIIWYYTDNCYNQNTQIYIESGLVFPNNYK